MAAVCKANVELAEPRPGDSASATIYPAPSQDTGRPINDVELPSPIAPINPAPHVEQGTSKRSTLALGVQASSRDNKQGIN